MARFTFPRNPHASVLINAGGSAQPDDFAAVQIDPGRREIDGTASSGLFCGQRPRYRVYFAAVFDRPLRRLRHLGRRTSSTRRLDRGRATARRRRPTRATTRRRPAPTRPSTPATTASSPPGSASPSSASKAPAPTSPPKTPGSASATVARPRRRRLEPGAGPDPRQRRPAAPARHLLHGALPRLPGAAHLQRRRRRLHRHGRAARTGPSGRIQYADFSGWDTYRTQIQLLSILAPRAGRARWCARCSPTPRESGCLPRWPYANGQSMTMVGDSADPIIASAAAFGAGAFDRRAALAAMLQGRRPNPAAAPTANTSSARASPSTWRSATSPSTSTPTSATPTRSTAAPTTSGARRRPRSSTRSTTSRSPSSPPARSRDRATYRAFMRRSGNWRKLFNPASGMIEPRYENGAFPADYDNLRGGGFVEGNSAQYSWMVPQDPAGLFRAMGGRAKAAARLDRFLRKLNGGPGGTHTDHALLGNEPTLHVALALRLDAAALPHPGRGPPRPAASTAPRPTATPATTTSARSPPGTCSAPSASTRRCPGVGLLAIGSPLFGRADDRACRTAAGRDLAAARSRRPRQGKRRGRPQPGRAPYIQALRLDGRAYGQALDHLLRARPRRHPRLPARPPTRTAAGAAPPPRRRRPSAPAARCRRTPARLDR